MYVKDRRECQKKVRGMRCVLTIEDDIKRSLMG